MKLRCYLSKCVEFSQPMVEQLCGIISPSESGSCTGSILVAGSTTLSSSLSTSVRLWPLGETN